MARHGDGGVASSADMEHALATGSEWANFGPPPRRRLDFRLQYLRDGRSAGGGRLDRIHTAAYSERGAVGVLGGLRHARHRPHLADRLEPRIHGRTLPRLEDSILDAVCHELCSRRQRTDRCRRSGVVAGECGAPTIVADFACRSRNSGLPGTVAPSLVAMDDTRVSVAADSAIRSVARAHPARGGCVLAPVARCHVVASESAELPLGAANIRNGFLSQYRHGAATTSVPTARHPPTGHISYLAG